MTAQKITRGKLLAGSYELNGLGYRTLRIPLAPTTSTTPVVTGARLPPKSIVTGVYVDLKSTASMSSPLIDVGVDNATTGFIAGLSVASAGTKQGSLATGAITLGSLLQEVTTIGAIRAEYLTPGASFANVTYSTRSVAARLEGAIVVEYKVLTT